MLECRAYARACPLIHHGSEHLIRDTCDCLSKGETLPLTELCDGESEVTTPCETRQPTSLPDPRVRWIFHDCWDEQQSSLEQDLRQEPGYGVADRDRLLVARTKAWQAVHVFLVSQGWRPSRRAASTGETLAWCAEPNGRQPTCTKPPRHELLVGSRAQVVALAEQNVPAQHGAVAFHSLGKTRSPAEQFQNDRQD